MKELCPHCMEEREVIYRPITDEERKGFGVIITKPVAECLTCKQIWIKI